MGWPQLKSTLDENRRMRAAAASKPPTQCPIDGTRLEVRGGIQNCPMGNYTWPQGAKLNSHR